MKKIKYLLAVIMTTLLFTNQLQAQTVNPTTAWWNNEDFEGYTLGENLRTSGGWANSSGATGNPNVYIQFVATATEAGKVSDNVLSVNANTAPPANNAFGSGSGNGPRGPVQKIFDNQLSGLVYIKTAFYHGTYGSNYILRDATGAEVFTFGGKNPGNGTAAAAYFTGSTANSGSARENWSYIESVLDLSNNKIIKIAVNNVALAAYSEQTLTTSHAGNIKRLDIAFPDKSGIGGLDNTTIGQLIADNIKALIGDTELQTLDATDVEKMYSVTSFTTAMALDLDIADPNLNIVWSIADWGTLSIADQALVSLTQQTDKREAKLTTTSAVSADATITLQAKFGTTELTKQVTLKASSTDALKEGLLTEIAIANGLISTVTDNNTYISGIKATLNNVITPAQAVYDNTNATIGEIALAVADLQDAESVFTSAIAPYNTFVTYITTVQSAHDAEVRTAAFFTAIKLTLQTAITTATGTRTTIAVAEDITAASATLQAALNTFNVAIPSYTTLETAIGTVTSRITAITPRIGIKFLNYIQAKADDLNQAKTDATTVLNTATTAEVLATSTTTLNEALTYFNANGQVAPSTNPYKIYTYGVGGEGHLNLSAKKILYADATDIKYSTTEESIENAEWIIEKTGDGLYTIKNKTLGTYVIGSTLSAGATNMKLRESKQEGGKTGDFPNDVIKVDDGYFLYGIVSASNSRGLEVDGTTTPTGTMRFSKDFADRGRFCFQFEEVPTPLVIAATETGVYDVNHNSDIIFKSDESTTAQLTVSGTLAVNGVVKLQKTFQSGKWYSIGFPFDVVTVYCDDFKDEEDNGILEIHSNSNTGDFWLKEYDGDVFSDATEIKAGIGYTIQFPTAFNGKEITFISENQPAVHNNNETLSGLTANKYTLKAHTSVANITFAEDADAIHHHYQLSGSNYLHNEGATITLKPFESWVVAKDITGTLRSIAIDGDGTTGLNVQKGNDAVVTTKYYNLQGQLVGDDLSVSPQGVYIVKQIHESGKTTTSKQIK